MKRASSDISDLPDCLAASVALDDAVIEPSSMPSSASVPSRATDFYELTKPRMNFLVVITTMVGYFMASRGDANWPRLLHTLLGTALTASGAAVLNQLIERDYDKLMPRTRNRPLPAGRVA